MAWSVDTLGKFTKDGDLLIYGMDLIRSVGKEHPNATISINIVVHDERQNKDIIGYINTGLVNGFMKGFYNQGSRVMKKEVIRIMKQESIHFTEDESFEDKPRHVLLDFLLEMKQYAAENLHIYIPDSRIFG